MIDWGADIIFGGHPHVVEPSEVVKMCIRDRYVGSTMGLTNAYHSDIRIRSVEYTKILKDILEDRKSVV